MDTAQDVDVANKKGKGAFFMRKNTTLTQLWGQRHKASGLVGLIILFGCSSAQAYDSYSDDYYYRSRHPEPKYNTVFKCHDSKGNVTMSNFECPNNTKMVAREDIKVRERRYTRYSGNQDWRWSQYNRPDYSYNYGNYAIRSRGNAAEVNAKYREAERQAEWDGWKNKDRSVTESKLNNLEAQRKYEVNRASGYLR